MDTYYTYNPTTKELAEAGRVVILDGATLILGQAADFAQYLQAYPIGNSTQPTPPEGKIAVPDGYELEGGKWVQAWAFEDAPPPPPRTFSKLKLYAALVQAGLWDALVAWLNTQTLEGVNAYTAFMLAQDLSDDNRYFTQWLEAAKNALGVSDEDAEAIIDAATV